MTTKIDSTLRVLQGHLNGAAAKKGAEVISQWEADMEKAEFYGAKTIGENLGKLRRHLESDTLDGSAIAGLLVHLGESTERAAAHAESSKDALERLGQALVKAGEGLRSGSLESR